jgi:ubiquitin-conjugating enzyme E2 S
VIGIAKELRKLSTEPPEGIKVLMNEDDVTDITADIRGPGTPLTPSAMLPAPASAPKARARGCR